MNLVEFIRNMQDWGIVDVMLPFILVFAVIYAMLQKTQVLGEKKKNLNMAVALVLGLSFVVPHVLGLYPQNADPVTILNAFLPQVSLVIIVVMMLLLLIGMFGADVKLFGGALAGWIIAFSILIIVWLFGYAANWWQAGSGLFNWLDITFGDQFVSIVIILLVFGIVVAFITAGEKDDSKKGQFMEDLKSVFR